MENTITHTLQGENNTTTAAALQKGLTNYNFKLLKCRLTLHGQTTSLQSFKYTLKNHGAKGEQLFDSFKANKAAYITHEKFKTTQQQSENGIDFKGFENLDFFSAILTHTLPKNLLIIDYDTSELYTAAKQEFKDFARAERTQKGGHIYLDITKAMGDASLYSFLRNALPYKLNERHFEVYWGGGYETNERGELSENRLLYFTPGLSTKTRTYYELEFDNLQPLPLELIEKLETTKGDFTRKTSPTIENNLQSKAKSRAEVKTPLNTPSRDDEISVFSQKWHAINSELQPILDNITQSGVISKGDLFALKSAYDGRGERTHGFKLENIQEGNRDNTIFHFACFLVNFGAFNDFSDFETTLLRITSEISNFSDSETKIKASSALGHSKRGVIITRQELEAKRTEFAKIQDSEGIIESLGISSFFIAKSNSSENTQDRYIVIDYTKGRWGVTIKKTCKTIALDDLVIHNPSHPQLLWGEKNGKKTLLGFKDENLPLFRETADISTFYQVIENSKGREYYFNPTALARNEKIQEILDKEARGEYSEAYLNDLRDFFANSKFNKVLTHNLLPHELIRAKFLGDLGNYLNGKPNANQALTILDNGDTGKSSILGVFLRYCMIGDEAYFFDYREVFNRLFRKNPADLKKYQARLIKESGGRNYLTADTLQKMLFTQPRGVDLLKHFTGAVTTQGINFVTDLSKDFTQKDFKEAFEFEKIYIKNTHATTERKGKDQETKPLFSFWVNCFNATNLQTADLDTNRYYFSYGKQTITYKHSKEDFNTIFGDSVNNWTELLFEIFKERERLLEYVLLIAPFEKIYPGYNNQVEITSDYTNFTLEQILENYYDGEAMNGTPKDFANALCGWLMVNGKINLNRLKECYESDSPALSLFACLLNRCVKGTPLKMQIPSDTGITQCINERFRDAQSYIRDYFSFKSDFKAIQARKLKAIFLRLFYYKETPPSYKTRGLEDLFARVLKAKNPSGDGYIRFDSLEFTTKDGRDFEKTRDELIKPLIPTLNATLQAFSNTKHLSEAEFKDLWEQVCPPEPQPPKLEVNLKEEFAKLKQVKSRKEPEAYKDFIDSDYVMEGL